jgi:hypothetical protein
MTVSELARVLIRNGLDHQYEQQNPWTRKAVEELLISLFGMEALVVKMYMEPIQSPKLGEEARVKIIKKAWFTRNFGAGLWLSLGNIVPVHAGHTSYVYDSEVESAMKPHGGLGGALVFAAAF